MGSKFNEADMSKKATQDNTKLVPEQYQRKLENLRKEGERHALKYVDRDKVKFFFPNEDPDKIIEKLRNSITNLKKIQEYNQDKLTT